MRDLQKSASDFDSVIAYFTSRKGELVDPYHKDRQATFVDIDQERSAPICIELCLMYFISDSSGFQKLAKNGRTNAIERVIASIQAKQYTVEKR